MDPLQLLVVARDATTPGARTAARADAAALRARGHTVTLCDCTGTTPDEVAPVGGGGDRADVVLTYGCADAAWAARTAGAPYLHLGPGPATDRAAGADAGALRDGYDHPRFKAVPSPGAQRRVLLEHGGRCWIVPPAVPPLAGAPLVEPAGGVAVGVLDPYPSPIDWVEETAHRLATDARVTVVRIAAGDPRRREQLAGAGALFVPSRGADDGLPALALEAAALGRAVLVADAEPYHGLLPDEGLPCFIPIDAPGVAAERILAVTLDAAASRNARAAAAAACARHTMSRRMDALEAALAEILAPADRERLAAPPAIWLPRDHGSRAHGRYTFAARFAADRDIVELVCGDGRGSVRLADAGARSVIGVDPSEVAIGYAQRLRAREGRLRFACMPPDALELGDACADLVVAFGVADGPADSDGIIAEAARVLRRHGTLLISKDNPRCAGAGEHEPAPASGWALDVLRERLEATFGRVTFFAERMEPDGLTIRGAVLDPERDAGWIAMATRPSRVPTTPTRGEETTARRGDRHAA